MSHGAGVGNESGITGTSLESIPYTKVSSDRARANWARAMEKLLPDIRQQISKKASSFPGILTLGEL
jgi:ribosome modulation factor